MTSSDINVILVKLEHLSNMIDSIHEQVKLTNGRVTALELEEARMQGDRRSKHFQSIIATSVVSGGLLAVLIWFVTKAI